MKRAFTLIELVVVVSIIAVLAGIVIVNTSNAQKQARDARRKDDLKAMQTALELYRQKNGSYPVPSCGGQTTGVPAGSSCFESHGYSGSDGYIPNLAPDFINVLPSDPTVGKPSSAALNIFGNSCSSGTSAGYLYTSSGSEYKIWTNCTFERTISANDPFRDPQNRPGYSVYSTGGGQM